MGSVDVVRLRHDHVHELEAHTAIFANAPMQPLIARHADAARQTNAVIAEQAESWVDEQARRAAAGRLMIAVPILLAATR